MASSKRGTGRFSLALEVWTAAVEAWSGFWLLVLEPHVNEVPDDVGDLSQSLETDTPRAGAHLSDTERSGILVPVIYRKVEDVDAEVAVNDTSFLSQLEQRTQQVKITLANLEAEKTRIEGLIARLQPLVPHYDALLEAERSINEAQIQLEQAQPAGQEWHAD